MEHVGRRAIEIYQQVMTPQQVEFTNDWWGSLVKDEGRLVAWVQKLYNSEVHGYEEYLGFTTRYKLDTETRAALRSMAMDECRHAGFLDSWLAYRGLATNTSLKPSQYWTEMQRHVTDFQSACAIKYYGERLAAERFVLLRDHPDTPDDLFHPFRWIAPDEARHCDLMFAFAGDEAIVAMEEHHKNAVANLVKKKS